MTGRKPLGIGAGAWAFAFLVYVAVLAATAPATLIDAGLRQATEDRLRVTDASGSLWSGMGRLEARDADGRERIGEKVAWRVRPASLLSARLVCDVRLAQSSAPFRAEISPASVTIGEADLAVPAAMLGLVAPRLAPLKLAGELRLRVQNLAIGRGGLEGGMTLQWNRASSALTPISPLGSYELGITAAGGSGEVRLSTLSGPLQLDGSGSWTKDRPLELLATARMPPDVRPQLAPLLRLIAVERPDDVFDLQLLRDLAVLPAERGN